MVRCVPQHDTCRHRNGPSKDIQRWIIAHRLKQTSGLCIGSALAAALTYFLSYNWYKPRTQSEPYNSYASAVSFTKVIVTFKKHGRATQPVAPSRGTLHPPTQEATAVKLWRNAQRVSSEALAKEDTLRRVPPKIQKGPRL
jgi:hypothetical protein